MRPTLIPRAMQYAAVIGLLAGVTTACADNPVAPTKDTSLPAGITADVSSAAPTIQNAELDIESGYCLGAVFASNGFSLYTGTSQRVDTPSGNTNYYCKMDVLIGPGVPETVRIQDVPFNDLFTGVMYPCDVELAKGGQAVATCHV